MYKEGQRILEQHRFQFPSNWMYSDNIDGEWGAFNDILKRKDSSIQTQVASLQMKIVAEDKVVENKTTDPAGWVGERETCGGRGPPVNIGQQKQVGSRKLAQLFSALTSTVFTGQSEARFCHSGPGYLWGQVSASEGRTRQCHQGQGGTGAGWTRWKVLLITKQA